MGMDILLRNQHYRVLKVGFCAGEITKEYYNYCEALFIVITGTARIVIGNRSFGLVAGMSFIIPPRSRHVLEVMEDFSAYFVTGGDMTLQTGKGSLIL